MVETSLIICGLGVYFLPTIVGYGKRNTGAIFALNALLGWTFIGWVVAFIWAVTKDDNRQTIKQVSTPTQADEIMKYKKMMDEGVITSDEFQRKKNQLIG